MLGSSYFMWCYSEFIPFVDKVPPLNELLLFPPEGKVKAIASTIFSIYWVWKSYDNELLSATILLLWCFLLTSFQSLLIPRSSLISNCSLYDFSEREPLSPMFTEFSYSYYGVFFLLPPIDLFDSVSIQGWVLISDVVNNLPLLLSFFISF